jgi:hypothetical protein
VSIVILLVLVAGLWVVVLAPSAWRRISERQGVGSIDHFHRQLQLLEHAGPKLVAPAYRLRGARSGPNGSEPILSDVAAASRPKLVLLRAVDDGESADIDGMDGSRYERVGVIERPEPPMSPALTPTARAAYRRQEARQRCSSVLRILTALAIGTGLLGLLPSMRLAWVFTGLTGLASLALVGLIAYAREFEGRRQPRRPSHARLPQEEGSFSSAAHAGLPGAWDDEGDEPLYRAAIH